MEPDIPHALRLQGILIGKLKFDVSGHSLSIACKSSHDSSMIFMPATSWMLPSNDGICFFDHVSEMLPDILGLTQNMVKR